MSIYDQVTRSGNPRNPVRALYSHWLKILKLMCPIGSEGRLLGSVSLSDKVSISVVGHGETGHSKRPNLELTYGPYRSLFQVTAKGEFRLGHSYSTGGWGSGPDYRNIVTRHTFIRWGHIAKQYVWWVDPEAKHGGYSWAYNIPDLRDTWRDPVPYLGEQVLQGWGEPHWMKLVPTNRSPVVGVSTPGFPWAMELSRIYSGRNHGLSYSEAEKRIAAYEALVRKRYRLAERRHLIETGVIHPVTKRLLPTEEEVAERRERDLQVLVAAMRVSQPARTRSLVRKTSEEEGLWQVPLGHP